MLKALADENRFQIIKLLSENPLCVCEIVERTKIPQNLVSHHISVLRKANLIDLCRCGKNNYYALNKQSLNKLVKILMTMGVEDEDFSNRFRMCDMQKTTRSSDKSS